MVEPGVVRFGLGPLTEVVAQHHKFAELAPNLDASVLPVVAQERVLRGEDLRDDPRASRAPDDPPLLLQPFEPSYVLPDYRADERLDGAVPEPALVASASGPVEAAHDAPPTPVPPSVSALGRALEDVVATWATQSTGEVCVRAVRGDVEDAVRAVAGPTPYGPITTPELLAHLAHAGASGGVHGRRRGGAAGRSLAWWVARCATGLDRVDLLDVEELEFRLEDVERVAFRTPGSAAWRLELALRPAGTEHDGEWSVAVAAFDRTDEDREDHREVREEEAWG